MDNYLGQRQRDKPNMDNDNVFAKTVSDPRELRPHHAVPTADRHHQYRYCRRFIIISISIILQETGLVGR
jgi:hypothetical protein